MNVQSCMENCCKLYTRKYVRNGQEYSFRKKAGVILYKNPLGNILETEIIIVQSNGNYWGFPKGGIEENESEIDCAKREAHEETGLVIEKNLFENCTNIYISRYYTYFLFNLSDIPAFKNFSGEIPKSNDSTGISLIKLGCLLKLYRNKLIKLNKQCIEIINRAFGVIL
jgi:8-oxo-dGTP pyrophosphatase MutT (NUDIX family)